MSRATEKQKMGRPLAGTIASHNRSLRLAPEMYESIAIWQKKRSQLGLKTTSECIRELLRIALVVEGIEIEDFGI